MRVRELQYELPPELIARFPPAARDQSRLLVLGAEGPEHWGVRDLPQLLPAGTLLVVNDTQVIPARLLGRKVPTGGKVELLLVRQVAPAALPAESGQPGLEGEHWLAMTRSSRPLRAGTTVAVDDDFEAFVAGPPDTEGLRAVILYRRDGGAVAAAIQRAGHVPLPPYLGRDDEPDDRLRYQTLFARVPGAVAAPTAGLHFSEELIDVLSNAGVTIAAITLHVGPGTFRPVATEDLDDHPMHAERFEVSETVAEQVNASRRAQTPVVAVGTTVVRCLEAAATGPPDQRLEAQRGDTRLLIQPGYRFRIVDGLVTNFHLPGSTLLALAYAFAGQERVAGGYREAIAERYRFYSYGDAMYLPRCVAPDPARPGDGGGAPSGFCDPANRS
ncbi:MAG: tRNA preQ1(34) S-adenosylmethionine ribosyltransferase-isomerase QueA [Deltaproteobacteria bacterium]|nr:tRNA preQ1(34) S-adenosylmethionine ribosyltransferase-isomerase QueA [Deltaproteobacteria bacterium]